MVIMFAALNKVVSPMLCEVIGMLKEVKNHESIIFLSKNKIFKYCFYDAVKLFNGENIL